MAAAAPGAMAIVLAGCAAGGAIVVPPTKPAAPAAPAPAAVAVVPDPVPPSGPAARRPIGAVTAESEAAADAGARLLARGGTAMDAVVAMAFVSAVVQPSSCGLGGGGFAVVWDGPTRTATVVDFRERAPGGLRLRDHLGNTPAWDQRGVQVGVPGFVAGLADVHALGGALPWSDVVEDAARLADQGFVVEPWLATAIRWSEKDLRRDPRAAFLFLDGGGLPSVGDQLAAPALAATLRTIAAGAAAPSFADHLVAAARAAGSSMTSADVARFEVVRREPLRVAHAGHEVLLPPPPSGGGVVVGQQLLMFGAEDLASLAPADAIHLGAEGMRASTAERRQQVGDPAFTRTDLALLLDPERLAASRRALPTSAVTRPSGPPLEDGGTCHLVAWDSADRVVSLTTTIGRMFGARIVTEGGWFLGDTLSDFAHDAHGRRVISRGPNFPRADARPASSMTPVVVLRDGAPVLAIGASGGSRIPSAVLQVMQRVLARDEALERAIDAPRWYAPSAGGLQIEQGLAALTEGLRARGESVEEPRPSFAGVSAVRARRDEGGTLFEAAVDPRKGGRATLVTP